MGLMDEIRKLTHPYAEPEDDYDDYDDHYGNHYGNQYGNDSYETNEL